jgi:hypothetical protein
MTARRPDISERVYRALVRLYPAAFRTRFGDEMVMLLGDQLRDARASGGISGPARTWLATVGDLVETVPAEHAARHRAVARSMAIAPSASSRLLGLLGMAGGLILAAAFVPGFPWTGDLFNLRLVLFNVGALAVIAAVTRRQAPVAPRLALAAAAPGIVANVWYLVLLVGLLPRPGDPGPGDFGNMAWFWSAIALWLSAAWFGAVTAYLAVISRWGAITLAVGSFLACLGIDRLGLVSGPFGDIVQSLAQAGILMVGIGWTWLGIDLATRRRAAVPPIATT